MGARTKELSWQEWRRMRAVALHKAGWEIEQIMEALDVCRRSVYGWIGKAREGGEESLRRKPYSKRARKLSEEQLEALKVLLDAGAEAAGFRGDYWTTNRVKELIWKQFEIQYHRGHMSRLLDELGYSVKKPVRRAKKRNKEAQRRFQEETLPALEKKSSG